MSELDNLSGVNSTAYTPSTRRVRAAYVHGVGGSTWYEGKAESLQKDFDRWLAEVKAEAWEEGYDSGAVRNYMDSPANPYRQES